MGDDLSITIDYTKNLCLLSDAAAHILKCLSGNSLIIEKHIDKNAGVPLPENQTQKQLILISRKQKSFCGGGDSWYCFKRSSHSFSSANHGNARA